MRRFKYITSIVVDAVISSLTVGKKKRFLQPVGQIVEQLSNVIRSYGALGQKLPDALLVFCPK